MSAHTSGPWVVDQRDRTVNGRGEGAEYVGPFVVSADDVTIATIEDDGAPGEAEANAQLTAAAPRLLVELKAAALALDVAADWCADHQDKSANNDAQTFATLAMNARTAIAKAEGRAK